MKKGMENIEAIRKDLKSGLKQKETAKRYGLTSVQVSRLFSVEERGVFEDIRKGLNKQERKYLLPLVEPVFTHRVHSLMGKDPVTGMYDLWNFPNDAKTMYKHGELVTEEGENILGNSTLNIPFIEYQPAKRIQQVAHSLVKWVGKDKLEGVTNFVHLDIPEKPLVGVKRHDVDTLNATIGFPTSDKDAYLTADDTCIISKEFAERFIFKLHTPQTILVSKKVKEEIEKLIENRDLEVWGGERFGDNEFPEMESKNIIKQDGKWRITTIKTIKESDYWVISGIIETHRGLMVGDKLRSLSGMKVVISEIRKEQEKDIVIHYGQIISKTGTKGALVKELLTCGKVMVGMRQDEVIGNNENLEYGGSISANIYPVLKLYAPKMLDRLLNENSLFIEYLAALHLTVVDNIIKLTPQDKGISAGHYCWMADILNEPGKFIGKPDNYKTAEITIQNGIYRVIEWENLVIPNWVSQGRYHKRQWEKASYASYLGKTLEDMGKDKYRGKIPYLCNPPRKREGAPAKGELNLPKKRLFPKIKGGCILRAIPTESKDSKCIVLSEYHRETFKAGKATIWREPVVGINNVYSMPVSFEDISPFVVRIPPHIAKAANGDFDGDTWTVIPEYDAGLSLRTHNIGSYKYGTSKPVNLESIKLVKRDSDMIIEEALNWKNKYNNFQKQTRELGGLRKRASYWAKTETEHKNILKLAQVLENTLKPERHDEELIKKTVKELNCLIPHKTNEKGTVSSILHPLSMLEVPYQQNVWRKLPGVEIPAFWSGLIGKRDVTSELLAGKTIYIGGI